VNYSYSFNSNSKGLCTLFIWCILTKKGAFELSNAPLILNFYKFYAAEFINSNEILISDSNVASPSSNSSIEVTLKLVLIFSLSLM
jgi:hypothetical protein